MWTSRNERTRIARCSVSSKSGGRCCERVFRACKLEKNSGGGLVY